MELFLNQSPPLTFLFGSAFWEEKQCMYQGQNTDLDLKINGFNSPSKKSLKIIVKHTVMYSGRTALRR